MPLVQQDAGAIADVRSVAVIMATYRNDRVDRFLAAFESVRNQQGLGRTAINIHVGVDGPVDDGLEAALQSVEAQGATVVRFPINRGLAPVLNDLIARLSDESFVFRMDADDVSFPGRFRAQLEFLCANPDVDILGTAILERTDDDRGERMVTYPTGHEAIVDTLSWRNPIGHPTVCFRRGVLDATGGYPLQNLSEDLAMWFHCARAGYRFANLPTPQLWFTVDDKFWTRRSVKRAWREYLVWSRGIWELHGPSWRLALPLLRLAFRLSPQALRRRAYASAVRRPGAA